MSFLNPTMTMIETFTLENAFQSKVSGLRKAFHFTKTMKTVADKGVKYSKIHDNMFKSTISICMEDNNLHNPWFNFIMKEMIKAAAKMNA
jgi:hypothetical protein